MKKENILKRFFSFLKGWYEKSFEKFEEEGRVGVELTDWVKNQLENGNADAIAGLTPWEWDNDLFAKGKEHIVPLFYAYAKAKNLAINDKDRVGVIRVVFEYLNSLGSRRSFWVEFSGDLIVSLADGKLSWNEAIILGQKLFWQFFNRERKLPLSA